MRALRVFCPWSTSFSGASRRKVCHAYAGAAGARWRGVCWCRGGLHATLCAARGILAFLRPGAWRAASAHHRGARMNGKQSVGVVGAGQMGMGVVLRLRERGLAVRVRDVRREAEEEARAAGAQVCDSPAALAAACAVVITLVVDEAQTEEVVFGPSGAAETLGVDAVLVMSSTVAPAYAESSPRASPGAACTWWMRRCRAGRRKRAPAR
ncbi:MAG: NAD(P)-binding domain-containing protein [Burkholderiales bacterium]|nr:NAD(P)-binding domain-containing protein [Burkholderiales bacterium]